MDFEHLVSLREHHPAWRLLRADSAPLVASVLHRVFVADNARTLGEEPLVEAVEDALFRLRSLDPDAYPRTGKQYVGDWADPSRGWLRKFYPRDSDVPSYDLTPAAEKALVWLDSLAQRTFVGTESRLLILFQLLEQIVEGSQEDPQQRLATLRRRRAELDAEIERVQRGEVTTLDDTGVRDRFQQFAGTARELLSDFREVEENFRLLDRGVRERITLWEGSRGSLLEDVFGERDAITQSDQGVSFRAFWDFLMSAGRQDEFNRLLEEALALPALEASDGSLRYSVHDWLKAADAVQATVAHLSQQLRRFLDDRAYLENRRISELMRSIEVQALRIRDDQPREAFGEVDEPKADLSIPMARRLYEPGRVVALVGGAVAPGDEEFAADALFSQFTVDAERLRAVVRACLADRDQISLQEVLARNPVTQGLAEVVTYLSLADSDPSAVFDDEQRQSIEWSDGAEARTADVPLVVFARAGGDADRA